MSRRNIDPKVIVNTNAKKAEPKAKRRIAASGQKLPEPLPDGMIVTNVLKRNWRLGKSIGVGGFGEIYLASDEINATVGPNAPFVIKIEHHDNGPLFAEIHFYHRAAKEEMIQAWVKEKKLDYLGMPRFVASGSHEYNGIKYRFMVMDRFGEDLQKILNRSNHTFSIKTVLTLGIRIIDILQYIHSLGYVHVDVKASNLLLGYGDQNNEKVFLIDFGLACRYIIDGKHKEYKEDLRKAHDGTIEFTSRDAHIGAHSRRGDLEVLGYNLLQWLCKRLPWEDNLSDPEYVSHQKNRFMSSVPQLMNKCFTEIKPPEAIATYLQYISQLKFDQEPDYNFCRETFRGDIRKTKLKLDMKLSFTPVMVTGKTNKRPGAPGSSTEDGLGPSSPKGRRRDKKNSPCGDDDDSKQNDLSLENPTPAMLLVMQRRLELQQQQRERRKKFTSTEADGQLSLMKDRIVKKYRERSPSPDVHEDVPSGAIRKLYPKDTSHQKAPRKPLATCTTQTPTIPRPNYSPEV